MGAQSFDAEALSMLDRFDDDSKAVLKRTQDGLAKVVEFAKATGAANMLANATKAQEATDANVANFSQLFECVTAYREQLKKVAKATGNL